MAVLLLAPLRPARRRASMPRHSPRRSVGMARGTHRGNPLIF
jgi:hypothetical protein